MPNGIHESLIDLAVDINSLLPLQRNPRVGDVDAIAASYEEFGQVKPIVARKNDDGTATVIAGNHQLLAAKSLGWDKIATIFLDADDSRAIAFAIADNRTMELGYSEPEIIADLLTEISDDYPELLEGLGWDEFEIAEYEQDSLRNSSDLSVTKTYVPPIIIEKDEEEETQHQFTVKKDSSGEARIVAPSGVDQQDIAVRGFTAAEKASAPQAVVQYTIVFDNPEQQARWYEFIRWLRNDPAVDGDTTASRLIDFIDQHIEI
jgi:ParB-like chromosome segregation protein Spo0J